MNVRASHALFMIETIEQECRGHKLVAFTPLRPGRDPKARYFRCTVCKGTMIDHPGMGFLDEQSQPVPRDYSNIPMCEGAPE